MGTILKTLSLISSVGHQPAISTVINTRAVPLTEAYANCIQCEDSVNDTNSGEERLSSTFTLCGDAFSAIDDSLGNAP